MQIGQHIASFESLREMHDYMHFGNISHVSRNDNWYGGLTERQRSDYMLTGDVSIIREAEAMLAEFDIRIPTNSYELTQDVVGFMPSVPDYLAGNPECMYGMEASHDARQPMSIIVNGSCSEGINHATLQKRGTVILAAVMAIAAIRPVTLEAIVAMGSNKTIPGTHDHYAIVRCKINTTPLDLPSACYALAHAGWIRGCGYGVARHSLNASGKWPTIGGVDMAAYGSARTDASMSSVLTVLGEDPEQSLFIPGVHLNDPLVTNPRGWIDSILERYAS